MYLLNHCRGHMWYVPIRLAVPQTQLSFRTDMYGIASHNNTTAYRCICNTDKGAWCHHHTRRSSCIAPLWVNQLSPVDEGSVAPLWWSTTSVRGPSLTQEQASTACPNKQCDQAWIPHHHCPSETLLQEDFSPLVYVV
jgi:hypothetical protein